MKRHYNSVFYCSLKNASKTARTTVRNPRYFEALNTWSGWVYPSQSQSKSAAPLFSSPVFSHIWFHSARTFGSWHTRAQNPQYADTQTPFSLLFSAEARSDCRSASQLNCAPLGRGLPGLGLLHEWKKARTKTFLTRNAALQFQTEDQ